MTTGSALISDKKITSRSPLRYPGGKSRGITSIRGFFPKNLTALLSPFVGGGSIELSCAAEGISVYAYDVFNPLVEFWQSLIHQSAELANEVETYFPLSKERFYALQQAQTQFVTPLQRAAVFYVLNRSSFSGATLSGGMSPDHPRFTHSSIERIRHFFNPYIQVAKADFTDSLAQHPDMFAYLDPPYLIKSKLYGRKGDTHKDFDHEGLCEILKNRKNWVLSYNDCTEIRTLYQSFQIWKPDWKYGMSGNKQSKEVLIVSEDLRHNLLVPS